MEAVYEGQVYRHFKGNFYQVLTDIATHTETGEKFVVYKRYNPSQDEVFIRPLEMFLGDIEEDRKTVNKTRKRFERMPELED